MDHRSDRPLPSPHHKTHAQSSVLGSGGGSDHKYGSLLSSSGASAAGLSASSGGTISSGDKKSGFVAGSGEDPLGKYASDLKNKHAEVRVKAAAELRIGVEADVRDMNSEASGKFTSELTGRVFDLVNSADVNEKLGGIALLDELIELKCESNETMIVRFANCVRLLIQQPTTQTDPAVLDAACKALGHLARGGGALTVDFVEFNIKQSLEWLQNDKSEKKRFAAVLVLKELAENTPTLFNVYAAQFLDVIWSALRDAKTPIREGAIEALRAALVDIARRDGRWKRECSAKLFTEALKGFTVDGGSVNSIHGSLLTIGELLKYGGDDGFIMASRFRDVCETVLKYKDHKNEKISACVVSLLPLLAKLSTDAFAKMYLEQCLDHILTTLKGANRDSAFIALGELALAVREHIRPKLPAIVPAVKVGLSVKHSADKKRKKLRYCETGLTCVGMLAKALGAHMYPHMDAIVDMMFETGLSQTLIDSLSDICANIPQLLPSIQDRLLDSISAILITVLNPKEAKSNKENAASERLGIYGSPAKGQRGSKAIEHLLAQIAETQGTDSKSTYKGTMVPVPTPLSATDSKIDQYEALCTLALQTLGNFDFHQQEEPVIALVKDTVLTYLDHKHPVIRKEAAVTCTKLIPRLSRNIRYHHVTHMIFEVLKRLVVVGIADPLSSIRFSVLSAFDPSLDKYLAQNEILQRLFVALNDEVFAIREVAITLLGRLSSRNPALVFSSLRKTLIQLLSELRQFSGETVEQEESAKLLGILIESSPQLIKPYVGPILNVLVPKLEHLDSQQNKWKDPSNPNAAANAHNASRPHFGGVASYLLSTLGKLSTIGGEDMIRHLDGLLPLIIDILQDKKSNIKRTVALRTLGQLVSSTGYVVQPYLKYPQLLTTILTVLKVERSRAVRIEVLKVLGTIGAFDPFKFKMNDRSSYSEFDKHDYDGFTNNQQHNNNNNGVDMATAGMRHHNALATADKKAGAGAADKDGLSDGGASGSSSEDYYPTVAIQALMRLLRDPSLTQTHSMVIKAIMFIFKSLGTKAIPFLPQIIPPFLREMRTCEDSLREAFFHHLCQMLLIVHANVRPHLDAIFQLIFEFWDHPNLLPPIVFLLEEISIDLREDFKARLPDIIPKLLFVLNNDETNEHQPTKFVLHALSTFAADGILDHYLYSILPALARLSESAELTVDIRLEAIQTIGRLARTHDISEHASRIIHPFARILSGGAALMVLHTECVEVLCTLVRQLGNGYLVFEPMITKVLSLRPKFKGGADDKPGTTPDSKSKSATAVTPAGSMTGSSGVSPGLTTGGPAPAASGAGASGGPSASGVTDIKSGATITAATLNISNAAAGGFDGALLRYSRLVSRMMERIESKTRAASEVALSNDPTRNDERAAAAAAAHALALTAEDDDWQPDIPKLPERTTLIDPTTGTAGTGADLHGVGSGGHKKLHVSQTNLMKAWAASQRSTVDDWVVWMRGFSIELLKESPSAALRACSALAQKYSPLARELFNAAFLSCWTELSDTSQDDLIQSLELTFKSPNIPPEIVQTLLNLAEFMEHHDKALPIDIRTLGDLAERVHAYAKALHYKETEFNTSPSATLEALISINNKLQQPEAARGILQFAQRQHRVTLKESWYEKLHRWEDGLEAYERKQLVEPDSVDCALGRMRCLRSLGEWERLSNLSADFWSRADGAENKRSVAPLAAAASIHLSRWDAIDRYVQVMDEKHVEGCFFRAILSVHRNQFADAQKYIDTSIELLDTDISALVGESYTRAYRSIVQVQQLIELNEVIAYKTAAGNDDARTLIRKLWSERLQGCQYDIEVWQSILSVRSLVISPKEDIQTWLQFASLCRRTGRLHLSLKVLTSLLGMDPTLFVTRPDMPIPSDHPSVTFACLKHLWQAGHVGISFKRLSELVNSEVLDPGVKRADGMTPQSMNELKSRCYLQLGQWQLEIMDDLDTNSGLGSIGTGSSSADAYMAGGGGGYNANAITQVLNSFEAATVCDDQFYKAWHEWAVMNFRIVSHYGKMTAITGKAPVVASHVIPAIEGFFRSIMLQRSGDNTRQDVLRLLQLCLSHGTRKDVEGALLTGINTVSIDNWLGIIPQIIARIHTPHNSIRKLLHELLSKIGKAHPQALVYPLTVATKTQSPARKQAAAQILQAMKQHSSQLVEQAQLVSHELVRVAILWHELWHEGIEEASRYWFGQKNVDGMLQTLQPLHDMMEAGPETTREVAFQQAFGRELQEAAEWCRKFTHPAGAAARPAGGPTPRGNTADLTKAWDIYSAVFRKVAKQLSGMSELELTEVSPKLLVAADMQLAVPGSYRAGQTGQSVVRIAYFSPTLRVIESKQHPRRLTIGGSDGVEYPFLLKGHEDLRQDERVMQLFGLVNTLLENDRTTAKTEGLRIRRYSVIPLSPNSGLIEWVPFTDTVHAVIKQYRDTRRIMLNIEQRLMLKMGPDYQHLTLIQKIEVFEYALSMTSGMDLCRVLWLKSPNAECWLDRRTAYTRSLAVMSMVGYVLGLGDRHPCNLMIDRQNGKIIHIDFGDCFEVAMHREKFPEKVPFRLTRMLVNAMEVSGIEGTFRSTCEAVLRVLRKNKNSVMAVLEAFVYDPLLNWRLLTAAAAAGAPAPANAAPTAAGNTAAAGTGAGSDSKKSETNRSMLGRTDNTASGGATAAVHHHSNVVTVTLKLDEKSGGSADSKSQHAGIAADSKSGGDEIEHEELNAKALTVIRRVEDKLSGTDFDYSKEKGVAKLSLDVPAQVQRLIAEATSHLNLCQSYIGWCPFW